MSDEPIINWYPTFKQIRARRVNPSDKCPCKSGLKFRECCFLHPDRKLCVHGPLARNQSNDA